MERNPRAVASSGRAMQTMGQIWTINQRAARDLMSLTEVGIRNWVDLNQAYLRRVAERPAPHRVLQLNAEYVQALFGVAFKDAEKRAEVMSRVSTEFVSALTGRRADATAGATAEAKAAADTTLAADPSVDGLNATVAERAAGPDATAREVQEAAQEAMDDDLLQIEGVGKAMAKTLRESGITTIAELAMLDVASLSDEKHPLHGIAGRIVADEWVEQARELSGLPRA